MLKHYSKLCKEVSAEKLLSIACPTLGESCWGHGGMGQMAGMQITLPSTCSAACDDGVALSLLRPC